MAVRRLINMIEGLSANKDIAAIRNDQGASIAAARLGGLQTENGFLLKVRVESISQNNVIVSTPLGSETAALATDEPFQAGQMVWMVRADDNTAVVLGSAQ